MLKRLTDGLDLGGILLEQISQVQQYFADRFEFENLDVLLKNEESITPSYLSDKMIDQGRGGLCYELNGLLHMVLRDLGIPVQLAAATIWAPPPRDGYVLDRTHVVTDEFCRTGVEGLFAIGDIAGAPWLAHKASHEGVMVAELVAGGDPHPIKPNSIPGCTYSNPQVASVGLTEEKAKAAGYELKIGRFPFIGNGKAIALGESDGLIKTIFDAKTGELLGAHMIGAEVTELIQGYVIGRTLETTEAELIGTVFAHPTLSEMMHESVLSAYGRAIHV